MRLLCVWWRGAAGRGFCGRQGFDVFDHAREGDKVVAAFFDGPADLAIGSDFLEAEDIEGVEFAISALFQDGEDAAFLQGECGIEKGAVASDEGIWLDGIDDDFPGEAKVLTGGVVDDLLDGGPGALNQYALGGEGLVELTDVEDGDQGGFADAGLGGKPNPNGGVGVNRQQETTQQD